jgi:hypothetical protein
MSQSEALYNDAQANEILRTAVRLAAPGEITFEEMVAAAAELGISRDELKDAEAQYQRNSSEVGQREEFKEMQKLELRSFGFHVGFIAAIVLLIVLIDFRHWTLYALPLLGLLWLALFLWKKHFLESDSPKHERDFQNWQRRKKIWLRPEQAQDKVSEALKPRLSLGEKLEQGTPRFLMEKRLRKKLGYDKKRARSVVEGYLKEHPEFEETFGT